MKDQMLPLGLDVGSSRVRIAAVMRKSDGRLHLLGVGAADVDGDVAHAVQQALDQIACAERRCFAAIRINDARLRCMLLPNMSGRELRRAVRFEGVSMFGAAAETNEIVVRSVMLKSIEGGRGRQTLVAAAPSAKIQHTLLMIESCGLRAVSIDHEACVLTRPTQLPLLDIGFERSTLIAIDNGALVVRSFELGGAFFTDALAREFGTSVAAAEVRKRTIGLGGAAMEALHVYVRALAVQIDGVEFETPSRVYVCGNGARLVALREKIAESLSLRVVAADLGSFVESELPREVIVSGAYDWFGAVASVLPSFLVRAA